MVQLFKMSSPSIIETMWCTFALVTIFTLFKETLSIQSFDKQPADTEVNPQDNTTLKCVVANKRGQCMWLMNQAVITLDTRKYELIGNQEQGDCSLMIKRATAEYDEGDWKCHVPAADYTKKDALTSQVAKLIVRAPPQEPRIENHGEQVGLNHNVTVKTDDKATLTCVSRFGNPPASLKWFLDDEELTAKGPQKNTSELENKRTWKATSTLELYVNKTHHGRMVKCVAFHASYPAKSVTVSVRLDITYPPEVTIFGVPTKDVEDGKDTVLLRCIADANPPAMILWQRLGMRDPTSQSDTLSFKPVDKTDSGTYSCIAKNNVGTSLPYSTTLDVKYAPIINSVGPDKLTKALLYQTATFECRADGNPPPKYQWIQKGVSLNEIIPSNGIIRSTETKLHFHNITYDYQGEYVCVVSNTIGGKERTVESQTITLQVEGAPQVMRHTERHEVLARRGEDALLKVVVCADPRPTRTVWQWGSLRLEAGSGRDRYQAEELLQDLKESCYEARFHVKQVDREDARNYHLMVENGRGADNHTIYLAVREPLKISFVFTVAVGSLVVFIFCVLLAVYILKHQGCCYRKTRRGDFKPTDLENHHENDKSEINVSNGYKPPKIEPMMDNVYSNEAMYCTSPVRRPPPPHSIIAAGCSPEAMKVRRAAMVLQPPTRV